jgi:hypothetical protein
MTKKFWNDWKLRLGETEEIYVFYEVFGEKRWHGGRISGLHCHYPFKILSANFNGNISVDLCLEITKPVSSHYTTENKYITLMRKDIATVKFKTKKKEGD